MRRGLGSLFSAVLQPRIDRKRHFRDFVNRSWDRRRFLKTVSGTQRLQFVSVNRIDDVAEKFAEPRVSVRVVPLSSIQSTASLKARRAASRVPALKFWSPEA